MTAAPGPAAGPGPDLDAIARLATAIPLPTADDAPAAAHPGRHVPAPLAPIPLGPVMPAAPRRQRHVHTVELSAADVSVLAALGGPSPGPADGSPGPGRRQRRDPLTAEGEADVAAFRAYLDAEGRVQPKTAATWSYTLRQVLREQAGGGALSALTPAGLGAWWLRPTLCADSRAHYRHAWDAVLRWRPDAPQLPAPVTAAGLAEAVYVALERMGAAASLTPAHLVAATWTRPLARVVGPALVAELVRGLYGRELDGGAWLEGRPVVPRWIGAPVPLAEADARELARWIGAGAAGRSQRRQSGAGAGAGPATAGARLKRRRWAALE